MLRIGVAALWAVLSTAGCGPTLQNAVVTAPADAAPVRSENAGEAASEVSALPEDDPFAALDQAFAPEAAGLTESPATSGGAVGSGEVSALPEEDPFAALDQAFAAEAAGLTESPAASGGAGTESAEVAALPEDDPFAALDRAFAAEAAGLTRSPDEAGGGVGRAEVSALPEADPIAALARTLEAQVARAAAPRPGTVAAWTRAVHASVTAAEDAAGEAEATARRRGGRSMRRATCRVARNRLADAVSEARELTVGGARPAFVTRAAGEQVYADLEERIAAARERGRRACEAI